MADVLDVFLKLPSILVMGQTVKFHQVFWLAIEDPLLQQRLDDVVFLTRLIENNRTRLRDRSFIESIWIAAIFLPLVHIEAIA